MAPANAQALRPEQPLSHLLLELPTGFADLCLSGDISPPVITIIKWIDRSQLMGDKGKASVPGWSDENHRFQGTTTIDMLLLQGVLAFCHQGGFDSPPWCFPASYESIESRLILVDDVELVSLVENRCMRDALVWIYTCAAGALYNRPQDAGESKSQNTRQSHELLLVRIFRLFENPRQLWWSNICCTLKRFWLPQCLSESWERCWSISLQKWRMSTAYGEWESRMTHGQRHTPLEDEFNQVV
jgi:hypothetical protein